MADEIKNARLRGEALVEQDNGFYEFVKQSEADRGVMSGKLVSEEVGEWHPDESGTARFCKTGEVRYNKK